MLYPLSIWQFQTLSLPPHLLFFQPWRVPICIVNVEVSIIAEHAFYEWSGFIEPLTGLSTFYWRANPQFFSFLNFSIYIILYFLLKIKLFLSTR